jgi:hypothetical protein
MRGGGRMMAIECEICGVRPDRDNISVFRVNPKGQAGVWRCEAHLETVIDQETLDFVHILEEGRNA